MADSYPVSMKKYKSAAGSLNERFGTNGFVFAFEGAATGLLSPSELGQLTDVLPSLLPRTLPKAPDNLPKSERVVMTPQRELSRHRTGYWDPTITYGSSNGFRQRKLSISHPKTYVRKSKTRSPSKRKKGIKSGPSQKASVSVQSNGQIIFDQVGKILTQSTKRTRTVGAFDPNTGRGAPKGGVPMYLEGGPFYVWKRTYDSPPGSSQNLNEINVPDRGYYRGVVQWTALSPSGMSTVTPTITSVTDSYGSEAYEKFKPKIKGANMAQMIAELKRAPSRIGTQFSNARSAQEKYRALGKEYLNADFGWKPLLQDVRSTVKTLLNAVNTINTLARDNGNLLHRKGFVARVSDSDSGVNTSGPAIRAPSPYVTAERDFTTTWSMSLTGTIRFAGAFTYYIPTLDDPDKLNQDVVSRLFDLNITPTLLYEIMPWSWMIDWFYRLGPSISNFEDQLTSNLVARYGYVMGHYRKVTKYNFTGEYLGPWQDDWRRMNCGFTDTEELKDRYVCNPFGYGRTMDSLSATQKATLAALGMSKL
jgi:hypothetical protein